MYPEGMKWLYTKPAIFVGITAGILLISIMVPSLIVFIHRKETIFIVLSILEIGVGVMSIITSILRAVKYRKYKNVL